MIQKLSSIKLVFYNLIGLILLMGAGVWLSSTYKNDFKVMNDILIFDWFKTAGSDTPILGAWFALLCLSAAVLLVNAACCSLSCQLSLALKSKSVEKWLFFIMHCLFMIILLCHGLILVVGGKQSNVTAFKGDRISFEDRYRIEISNIVFKDDIEILKLGKGEQRAKMTRDHIHRVDNFASISLYEGSNLLKIKDVIMLSPLRHRSIQVTMTQFIVKEKEGKDNVGVKITITRNYFNILFFLVYGLMILAMGAYLSIRIKGELYPVSD